MMTIRKSVCHFLTTALLFGSFAVACGGSEPQPTVAPSAESTATTVPTALATTATAFTTETQGAASDTQTPGAPTASATTASATTAPTVSPSPSSTGISKELAAANPPPLGFPSTGTRTGASVARDPAFQPLDGTDAYHGRLGDAVFRAEFPAGWDGDGLLLWAHGFRSSAEEVRASSPPRALREAILASGYGWAASSFSENGYTPGIGADDTLALKLHMEETFGDVGQVVIAGQSMGGNVVVLALESFPGVFAGGLSYCGAVGGVEQLDFLLSWGLLAEHFTGIHLPVGETSPIVVQILQMGVILGAPESPSSRGVRFTSAVRELTGGPRPFFVEGFVDQYTVNFGLLVADNERRTVQGASTSNLETVYGIDPSTGADQATLNAEIRRIGPLEGARDSAVHPDAVPTTGRLSAPLLTLHNTGDLFVPISLEVEYRRKVEALGLSDLLVQRAIRAAGHCRFSGDEFRASWSDLVGWVDEGSQPLGEVLGPDLSDVGLDFTVPLREGDPGER